MVERYPFFVYGTLIPGQPNDFYWEECLGTIRGAVLRNGRLYDMGAFPMLLEGGDSPVKGQVVYPKTDLSDEDYQLLVQRLDTLENYKLDDVDNSPYYRVLRNVILSDDTPVTAWVYLGRPQYTQGRPLIPNGDWVRYSANAADPISVWWKKRGEDLLFGKDG